MKVISIDDEKLEVDAELFDELSKYIGETLWQSDCEHLDFSDFPAHWGYLSGVRLDFPENRKNALNDWEQLEYLLDDISVHHTNIWNLKFDDSEYQNNVFSEEKTPGDFFKNEDELKEYIIKQVVSDDEARYSMTLTGIDIKNGDRLLCLVCSDLDYWQFDVGPIEIYKSWDDIKGYVEA